MMALKDDAHSRYFAGKKANGRETNKLLKDNKD